MASVMPIEGTHGGESPQPGWIEGEVRDGLRSERVRARLLRVVAGGPFEDDHAEGVFAAPPALLSMGRAARLKLDDGRGALIVMVSGDGRFHTVGRLG